MSNPEYAQYSPPSPEKRNESHEAIVFDAFSQEQSITNCQPKENDRTQPSLSSRDFTHLSVRRNEISSTTIRESDDLLEDLDVEVYDQQTYEKGVFDQVNKALSNDLAFEENHAAFHTSVQQPSNDFMSLLHDQNQELEDVVCDPQARDEQVLQLTRQERLKRTIKKEKHDHDNFDIGRIPRIPRIAKDESEPSTSSTRIKVEPPTQLEPASEQIYVDSKPRSDKSAHSIYEPPIGKSKSDEDDTDDDFDYETDAELGPDVKGPGYEVKKSTRRIKTLEDDGDFKSYQSRMKALNRAEAQARLDNILEDGTEFKQLDEFVHIDDDLQLPKNIWDELFEHQKTGVRWLWELHQLGTGGILGDEMGLGKTIQIIAFLAALKSSDLSQSHKNFGRLGPIVLVCPATVMHQWLQEFRKWSPRFRVAILHSTGTFSGNRKNLVQAIHKSCGVLIVSYPGVVIYQDYLHDFDWHYAILDEGHKIRNPDAQITLACKRFRTPHRIILSGSPIQNNLKELWSIFDFIYPGKLGTLPVFMEQFATPITQGGYANASDVQVQIAYKCTCVLRDTIKPFLLRRTKAEVNNKLKLPERSEQVLFCKLTDKQRELYQHFLESPTVKDIRRGFCQIFVGLIQLRKICNHPDLFDASDCQKSTKTGFLSEDETFGHFKKSGKMNVVNSLLKIWKKQNHKVLLFTQSRQMLKIFETFLDERSYRYLTMDGATAIGIRQNLIHEFNTNNDVFIFLLTTRVGGVGINLIGADRIIIFDPDWNPSTDIQARERAWRIGQQRHVIIYRLLTVGTIEEKIYHRQVFKLYLTNRVLKDAKQKRFFKTNDLHELFSLGDKDSNIETETLFDDSLQINAASIKRSKLKKKFKTKKMKQKLSGINHQDIGPLFSEEKLQAMRDKAKILSKMIAEKYGSSTNKLPENQVRVKIEPGLSLDKFQSTSSTVIIKQESNVPCNLVKSHLNEKKSKIGSSKQRVKYLVKQDVYRPDRGETTNETRQEREDYILERLFKNSNISGALKHDKIETDSTADYKVVESEAEKVARDAIRALRESRRLCLGSMSGIPNWTGRNGQVASRPRLVPKNKSMAKRMGQPSMSTSNSESLMASIKKRNYTNPVSLARNTSNSLDSDDEEVTNFEGKAEDTGADGMADRIRRFILYDAARSGQAQTEELLDFFKTNFKPDKTPIFKALLYKMCEFERRGDVGFWFIKSEFRDM